MSTKRTIIAGWALLSILVLLTPQKVSASGSTVSPQEFDQAFNEMIHNPSDAKLARHYSDLAVAMGNYEAAIPPLERMLLIDPDQADLKLLVGSYYMKLGSNDMAKTYLADAKKTPGASQDIIKQADSLLGQIH